MQRVPYEGEQFSCRLTKNTGLFTCQSFLVCRRESDDDFDEAQAPRPRRPQESFCNRTPCHTDLMLSSQRQLTHGLHVLLYRGLGLIVESDFYTTPAGRQHFANQLQSIRVSWLCLVDVHPLPIDPCKQLLTTSFLLCVDFGSIASKKRFALKRLNPARPLSNMVSVC